MDRVQGYDEDQIALVVPDESKFTEQVPVILETPTISCIMNVMKEREIDALAMPWANARVVHLLSMHRVMATVLEDQSTNPNRYNEVVFMRNTETIEAFSSQIISVKMERAYKGECINVMTQTLQTENSSLPEGLTIQNVYTELWKGSKKCSHGGKEQYGLPPNALKESSGGQGGSCNHSARKTTRDQGVRGGGWTSGPSST